MKQAISGAMANRKRTMKMTVKNQPKNDGTIVAAINHKTTVRLTTRVQHQLAIHEHQPDGFEVIRSPTFIGPGVDPGHSSVRSGGTNSNIH